MDISIHSSSRSSSPRDSIEDERGSSSPGGPGKKTLVPPSNLANQHHVLLQGTLSKRARRAAKTSLKGALDDQGTKLHERFAKMCQDLGMSSEQSKAFKKVFIEMLVNWDPDNPKLTPAEQQAVANANLAVEEWMAKAPNDVSKLAQFKNKLLTGTLACVFGFGIIVMITKLPALNADFSPRAFNLTDVAGCVIFMLGEVMSGSQTAYGAGYAGSDNLANQSADSIRAERYAKGIELTHLTGKEDSDRYKNLSKEVSALNIEYQKLVPGVLLRESGWKAEGGQSKMPQQIRSNYKVADDGWVTDKNGKKICQFTENTGMVVRWPNGVITDLKTDDLKKCEIPTKNLQRFASMQDDLFGAMGPVRQRAFRNNEVPFLLFGAWYMICGSMTPFFLEKYGHDEGRKMDFGLTYGCCLLATISLVFEQNRLLSNRDGTSALPGWNTKVNEAKLDKANVVQQANKLHRTGLKEIHAGLKALKGQMVKNQDPQEEIKEIDDALEEIVKALAISKKDMTASRGEVDKVEGWMMSRVIKAARTYELYGTRLKANLPFMAAKVISYSIPYLLFTQLCVRYTATLDPNYGHSPTVNGTAPGMFMNSTDVQTDVETFEFLWKNILGNLWIGFEMGIPFMGRNLAYKPILENAGWQIHRGAHFLYSFFVPRNEQAPVGGEDIERDAPEIDDDANINSSGQIENDPDIVVNPDYVVHLGGERPTKVGTVWEKNKDPVLKVLDPATHELVEKILAEQHQAGSLSQATRNVLDAAESLDDATSSLKSLIGQLLPNTCEEIFGPAGSDVRDAIVRISIEAGAEPPEDDV